MHRTTPQLLILAILWVAYSPLQTVFAKAPPVDRAERYALSFYDSKTSSNDVSTKAINESKPGAVGSACSGTVCAETQAVFLLATIAAIEGMKQANELAGIKRQQLSNAELAKSARDAANHLLTASETAAGFVGLAVARKTAEIPLQVFNSLIMNSTVRPLLGEFLTSGAANLVGFVGFEVGAELASRAAQMIGNEADRKKAQLLIPTFWSALTTPSGKQSKDDLRVLGLLFENVNKILQDSDLREKWWSFAVRNRIATGDFMAGVSVMTLSTIAASRIATCIPNPAIKYIAAPIIGGAFGVAGGVAIGYVPKEGREAVTRGLQTARLAVSARQIETAELVSGDLLRKIENEERFLKQLGAKRSGADWKITNQKKQLDEQFGLMAVAREDLFTAYYDRLHHLNARLYELHNKLVLAKEHDNSEAAKKLQAEIGSQAALFNESLKPIDRNFETELAFLNRAAKTVTEPETVEKIKKQLSTVTRLKAQTTPFFTQLQTTAKWNQSNASSDGLMTEQENQRLLEKIYLWGFKEKVFLQTMDFNN